MTYNKNLFLILKSKWYHLIECGEKKEEYREINNYWISRLTEDAFYDDTFHGIKNDGTPIYEKNDKTCKRIKRFDNVIFQLGYTKKDRMSFKIKDLTIGKGKEEWGAEADKTYFIIKLGEKIN